MTLLELMAALAILGLCTGLIFSNLGPWLTQARDSRTNAEFWRQLPGADLTLSELTAAAIEPRAILVTPEHVRFEVYLSRLSPAPTAIDIGIENQAGGSSLILRTPQLNAPSVLLANTPPLRFRRQGEALMLESQTHGQWRIAAIAAFQVNAPLACSFDPIARSCR